jgi:hypothetical protein
MALRRCLKERPGRALKTGKIIGQPFHVVSESQKLLSLKI